MAAKMSAGGGVVRGLEKLNANLSKVFKDKLDAAIMALEAEAEIEMTEAKRRTPVDTGALRASGHVKPARRNGRDITVELDFGGPSAPYAVFVHEDMEAFHRVGQAKFLESVLVESAPHMAARVAQRMRGL
jgi:hypothetical protein